MPQQASLDPNLGTSDPKLMLFGQRGAPPGNATQQQLPVPSRRLELPNLNFLPLVPEDPQQQGHALGPSDTHGQQRGVAPSAAAELAAEQAQRAQHEGETNEELLLRRTKEYNVATRERPLDVSLWLDFARFQVRLCGVGVWWVGGMCTDHIQQLLCYNERCCCCGSVHGAAPLISPIRQQSCWSSNWSKCCQPCHSTSADTSLFSASAAAASPLLHPLSAVQDEVLRLAPSKRGGERGAAEKKIAILEKALSLHPGSDELLLALLKAVSGQRAAVGRCRVEGHTRCMTRALQCCHLMHPPALLLATLRGTLTRLIPLSANHTAMLHPRPAFLPPSSAGRGRV